MRVAISASAVAGAAIGVAGSRQFVPTVTAQPTKFNQALLSLCPSLTTPYRLPRLLCNGHPHLLFDREIVHMPDGGCVTLDTEDLPPEKASGRRRCPGLPLALAVPVSAALRWDGCRLRRASCGGQGPCRGGRAPAAPLTRARVAPRRPQRLPDDAPVLILLPGLTGGSEDSYVQHAVVHARETGFRAIVFNSRGTSESPVTTAQFYSASFTGDLRNVVAHVGARYPRSLLLAAGWSLGANILTRYLELPQGTLREVLGGGFNRVYDANLARALRRIYAQHHALFEAAADAGAKPTIPTPTRARGLAARWRAAFQADLALRARSIREFDDAITRIAFDWPSVDAYYEGSSSSLVVPDIRIPLLVIQAEDDPIAPKEAIPFDALRANPNCLLCLTPTGGHLGWCSGPDGPTGAPWTDRPVQEFITAARQLLAQPQFAQAPRPPQTEPAGMWTLEETTHQAP
eukprot:scaffold20.g7801.t1